MLLLDTSFPIEFENELVQERPGAASAVLMSHRSTPAAISIVTLGELSRRLGENDAWIAGTAIAHGATLIGRERAFARVPRLDYLAF